MSRIELVHRLELLSEGYQELFDTLINQLSGRFGLTIIIEPILVTLEGLLKMINTTLELDEKIQMDYIKDDD